MRSSCCMAGLAAKIGCGQDWLRRIGFGGRTRLRRRRLSGSLLSWVSCTSGRCVQRRRKPRRSRLLAAAAARSSGTRPRPEAAPRRLVSQTPNSMGSSHGHSTRIIFRSTFLEFMRRTLVADLPSAKIPTVHFLFTAEAAKNEAKALAVVSAAERRKAARRKRAPRPRGGPGGASGGGGPGCARAHS